MLKATIEQTKIQLVQGDITEEDTDAIVNAANSSLMGGGGVDGAIHRRGGPAILKDCEGIRRTTWKEGLPTGQAVITSGGNLKARYVIHTVGPVWNGGNAKEQELLANCYVNCLKLAELNQLGSIAFPSISTGAFGYPIRSAGKVALSSVRDFILKKQGDTPIKRIVFVLFTSGDLKIYEEIFFQTLKPFAKDDNSTS